MKNSITQISELITTSHEEIFDILSLIMRGYRRVHRNSNFRNIGCLIETPIPNRHIFNIFALYSRHIKGSIGV